VWVTAGGSLDPPAVDPHALVIASHASRVGPHAATAGAHASAAPEPRSRAPEVQPAAALPPAGDHPPPAGGGAAGARRRRRSVRAADILAPAAVAPVRARSRRRSLVSPSSICGSLPHASHAAVTTFGTRWVSSAPPVVARAPMRRQRRVARAPVPRSVRFPSAPPPPPAILQRELGVGRPAGPGPQAGAGPGAGAEPLAESLARMVVAAVAAATEPMVRPPGRAPQVALMLQVHSPLEGGTHLPRCRGVSVYCAHGWSRSAGVSGLCGGRRWLRLPHKPTPSTH
jgi:hypothetical protein